jgi:hypothetical protein
MEKLDKSLDKKPLEAPHTGIFFGVISGSPVGGGVVVDAMTFGGSTTGSYGDLSSTEEWNGSSWSGGDNLTGARESGGSCGDGASNGRYVNGYNASPAPYPNSNRNEQYNGTSWSSDSACPQSYNNVRGNMDGSVDDCIMTNGHANGSGDRNYTFVWNGTSWGSEATQATGSGGALTGVPNDCVMTKSTSSYEYNGSSWSAGGTCTTRNNTAVKGGVSSTDAFIASGVYSPRSVSSEYYNGTSWTSGNPLVTGYYQNASAGNSTSNSMSIGGGDLPNSPAVVTNVQDQVDGTWSTGTPITTARDMAGGAGT